MEIGLLPMPFSELGRVRLLPFQIEFPIRARAVAQIQVDQTLVGNAYFFGNRFEIFNAIFIQPNRNLFFQLRRVGICFRFGKIVFGTHSFHLNQ